MSTHTDTTDTATPQDDRPPINTTDLGVRVVFTDVDGSPDAWFAVDKSACVSESEWY